MLEREMRANMREYQGAVHSFQKIASCWSTHLVNMTCNLVSLQIVVSGRQLLLPDPVVATARGFRVPTRVEFYIVWVAEAPSGNVSPQARPRRMSLLRK